MGQYCSLEVYPTSTCLWLSWVLTTISNITLPNPKISSSHYFHSVVLCIFLLSIENVRSAESALDFEQNIFLFEFSSSLSLYLEISTQNVDLKSEYFVLTIP